MNNEDFYLSKRTRRAMFIFVALLCLVSFLPRIIIYLFPDKPIHITIEEKKIFQNLKYTPTKKFEKKKKVFKVPPSNFDTNSYTTTECIYLGLTEKQSNAVMKFGKYGFYSNEQLAKVFVIPKEVFRLIKDSTFYPDRKQFFENKNAFKKEEGVKPKIVLIEINQATEDELQSIKGIGPFFAKNIIKQREKLGGFISKQQLLEVWQFTPEKLTEIESSIQVNPSNLKKININLATVEELKNHPYISWNIANSIVKMRLQKGNFNSINDLLESKLITIEIFEKIKPYLTL
ncbi:MAG: ComEA family DNA-binding protein [Crocinitomicaceae bacterium]